ncbi:MAG: pilus assembly protein TadG-related protein [Hyphomicrobium sp.]
MRRRVGYVGNASGSVAILFGLLVPGLIGFTGLAVDGAYWMMERNKLQATTDGAAISATHSLQLDGGGNGLTAEATKVFAKAYGDGAGNIDVAVNSPPQSGPMAGNTSAVEITASRPQPVFFLGILGVEDVVVAVRSVARIDQLTEACLLSLADDQDKSIEITGNAAVNLNCGIASNSLSSTSVYMSGSSTINATGVSAVGDIYKSNGSDLETGGGPMKSHAPKMTDPYGPEGRNLQVPATPAGCTANKLTVKNTVTLTPGRYCNGIKFQNGTATLAPGTYIIDGGDFSANAQATIVGDNVTIILTGSGSNYAGLDINGGATLALNAPKSGTAMDGVLFFQDPNAPTYKGNTVVQNKLNGNADMELSGAMYFPKQGLTFSGGSNASISCLQIVGYKVSFNGNTSIGGTCDTASGTERLTRVDIELVE